MNTAANLWESGPKMRLLRPGEQLQNGQALTVGDFGPFGFIAWQWCGSDRYALLSDGTGAQQWVAHESLLRVEVGADDDGKQEKPSRLRGRTSTANARRRRA